MKISNSVLIEALRKQIQPIAFDANLFDLGIADYTHARNCSDKRKKLNEQILALGGVPKPLPFQKNENKKEEVEAVEEMEDQEVVQLDLFV